MRRLKLELLRSSLSELGGRRQSAQTREQYCCAPSRAPLCPIGSAKRAGHDHFTRSRSRLVDASRLTTLKLVPYQVHINGDNCHLSCDVFCQQLRQNIAFNYHNRNSCTSRIVKSTIRASPHDFHQTTIFTAAQNVCCLPFGRERPEQSGQIW